MAGLYGYAQTEEENDQGADASEHGKAISELAKTTTATGREKGALISSAARAKGLMQANANARFIRGDAAPQNAGGQPTELINPNGQPVTLPPVTAPTMGKPSATPVGKPAGVPVGSKPSGLPGGN